MLGCKGTSKLEKQGLHRILQAQVADQDRTFPYPMNEKWIAAKALACSGSWVADS